MTTITSETESAVRNFRLPALHGISLRALVLTLSYLGMVMAAVYALYVDFERRAREVAVIQAESNSVGWAKFFGHGIAADSNLFSVEPPTAAERRLMEAALSVPGVFLFKLFDINGQLLLISDHDGVTLSVERDHHAEVAAEVARTGITQSFLKERSEQDDRPDVYVESYVPVRVGGEVVGVAEVYLDGSATTRHFRLEFLALGVLVAGAVALLLCLPCLGLVVTLRRLRAQRRDLIAQRTRAERAEQVKADFMACMSHDLRTPLNSILGFADLMRLKVGRARDPDGCAEYADLIHTSGSNMLTLVNDILDLSAVELSKTPHQAQLVDLKSELSTCISEVRSANADRNVAIQLHLHDDVPAALVDPHVLRRIATNILSNAVKFTADGGRVDLRAYRADDAVCIDFTDTGIGLAPEDIEIIVEPFTQLGGDPQIARKGIGLGLPIVKALLDKAGGEMVIKSKLGSGTTVTVSLPAG